MKEKRNVTERREKSKIFNYNEEFVQNKITQKEIQEKRKELQSREKKICQLCIEFNDKNKIQTFDLQTIPFHEKVFYVQALENYYEFNQNIIPTYLRKQINDFKQKIEKKQKQVQDQINQDKKKKSDYDYTFVLDRTIGKDKKIDFNYSPSSDELNDIQNKVCDTNFKKLILDVLDITDKQWDNLKYNVQILKIQQFIQDLVIIKLMEKDKIIKLALDLLEEEKREFKDYECLICLDIIENQEDMHLMELCSHIFHVNCLSEYFITQFTSKKFPILCPENLCNVEVAVFDLKKLLTQEQYYKCEEFQLGNLIENNNQNFSCCPTADCKYVFFKDDNINDFVCPLCKFHYCLKCRVEFHKSFTCEQFQKLSKKDENDYKFEEFVQGQKFKQCPKCKFWVQRSSGCNHMTCRCKCQFCYVCGSIYKTCNCPQYGEVQENQRNNHENQEEEDEDDEDYSQASQGSFTENSENSDDRVQVQPRHQRIQFQQFSSESVDHYLKSETYDDDEPPLHVIQEQQIIYDQIKNQHNQ